MLRVGPDRSISTIAEAARIAGDGDRIEVDAGDYSSDVATWRQNDISISAVGGRVRLLARGAAAEGKGTWVVGGSNFVVEGFDFFDAAVPDGNGAGIRFERGSLLVRDCSFMRNQMGILTAHDPNAVLEVAGCEFAHNSRPEGPSHHLYAGNIGRLAVTGSYFHHASVGHLLKSRAALNEISYNRLTDERGGRASYELEFPVGGVAYVIGNVISQAAQTENPTLISFGAEGYKWPANELILMNNTLIDRPGQPGICLAVRQGADAARLVNNLMVGQDSFFPPGVKGNHGNVGIRLEEFQRQTDADFRLKAGSPLIGKFSPPGRANGKNLTPEREYVHPRRTAALTSPAHNPGAMQSLAGAQR